MNIINKNTNELIPYENNPRNNENAVEYVANSIKQFGFKVPIIIDRENVVVAGHTRLLAAKLLQLESVPCIVADDLTEEQIKQYRLADNKVSEFSKWDFEKLDIELNDIDFNMGEFGFITNIEFDDNIDDFFENQQPEKPKEPKTITCPHCGEVIEL